MSDAQEGSQQPDGKEQINQPITPFTDDDALVFAILKAGLAGYFAARDRGLRTEHIHGEAQKVFNLFADFSKKGRLPTLAEISAATGVVIGLPDEPIDVEIFATKIADRALKIALRDGLKPIIYDYQNDPAKAREDLIQVIRDTAWSSGGVHAYADSSSAISLYDAYQKAKSKTGELLGLSSPWPSVDKSSLGLQNGELTVLLAKRKSGKCNSFDTILHDPYTGWETTIQEVVEERRGVLTWSEERGVHATTPNEFMDCGEMKCVRVRWRSGREMVVAPTHPFLTPTGYRCINEIEPGHHTAAAQWFPAPLRPSFMEREEIVVLAYMIADGGCTSFSTPNWTKNDAALVAEMGNALSVFGASLSPIKGKRGSFYIVGKNDSGRNPIVALLKEHGLIGKKSIEKEIPKAIFSLPNASLGFFIGRLWSCDGCVEGRGTISYSTGSHRIALQVQHLLLRFGITSRVRTMKREIDGEVRDYYEIYVHRECTEAFKTHIGPGFIGPKTAKLAQVEFKGPSRVGWLKNDELRDQIRAEMDERPELLPQVGEALEYSCTFMKSHPFDSKSGRIRRRVFEAFCEVYDSPLKWVLDESIWWDEVESIEPAGEHHCYDLNIQPTSCYVANDYVVHNSWILCKWLQHIWRNDLKPGECALLVSMEMPVQLIWRRLAALDLGLCYADFRGGKLVTPAEQRFYKWVEESKNPDPALPRLFIVGPNSIRTVSDIADKAAELNPKIIGIDGFYILGRDRRMSMWERTMQNVSEIKLDLCSTHDVPVLATTQIKGSKDKESLDFDADDAAFAKAIGDYADAMRGLAVNKMLEAAKERHFLGMESREFRPVSVVIRFDLDHMRFDEVKVIGPGVDDDEGDSSQFGGAGASPTDVLLAGESDGDDGEIF